MGGELWPRFLTSGSIFTPKTASERPTAHPQILPYPLNYTHSKFHPNRATFHRVIRLRSDQRCNFPCIPLYERRTLVPLSDFGVNFHPLDGVGEADSPPSDSSLSSQLHTQQISSKSSYFSPSYKAEKEPKLQFPLYSIIWEANCGPVF